MAVAVTAPEHAQKRPASDGCGAFSIFKRKNHALIIPPPSSRAYIAGMESIVRNVRDIDAAAPAPETAGKSGGGLPDWCNVYEGLTDEEIDDIEQSIVGSPGGRTFE